MRLHAHKWIFNTLLTIATATIVGMLVVAPLNLARFHVFVLGDLRAFYCSARVSIAGFDPYRAEPIGNCERSSVNFLRGNFVIPAPLPGHAIALFEPLARLPFPVAAVLWCILLGSTFFAISIMMTYLTAWPYAAALITFLPLAYLIPINQGQLVPIDVALLIAATLALRGDRDSIAALLTAVATIEPHIGLPACATLFIARPRARAVLCLAALAAGVLSVNTVGLAATMEYVQRVLPQHIASEARYDDQYSLTYFLSWLNVPVALAIALGQCWYWMIAVAGVGIAIALQRRANDVRFLLFVPLALSVTGGPYVHEEHLLAAVPLGMLLAATSSARARGAMTLALVLVAWPAKFLVEKFRIPALTMHLSTQPIPVPMTPSPILADAAWATRIAENGGHWPLLLVKLPSWLGLLLLVATIISRSRIIPLLLLMARVAGTARSLSRSPSEESRRAFAERPT